MSPHETLFRLEATQGVERALVDHTPLCRFTIWDFPGDQYGGINGGGPDDFGDDTYDDTTDDSIFSGSTSLIFVVDAQDEPYDHVLQSFTTAVTRAVAVNPNIAVEVFINKVDGELFLSDESKYDCRRDIMSQVSDELTDAGVSPDAMHIRYHLTSIYDHSVYEALSRVVQRLIPQLPTLENLLNILVFTCAMEKAYLFDVVSKLYISTDSGPVDMQSVELCSDMIDVVLDVSGIYGLGPSHAAIQAAGHAQRTILEDHPHDETTDVLSSKNRAAPLIGSVDGMEGEMIDPDSAYDNDSASVIRLSNGMVRFMVAMIFSFREQDKHSPILYNRFYT
jgi:Ras-related GTP-binding protein C/D